MKILVTGGLGTVGAVLVRELRRRGHDVHVSDLRHHHDPKYIRCDVGSHAQVQRLFRDSAFDYVYHLAAEFGRWNGEDYYDTLWQSNVIGTKNILREQEQRRFRLIFFSSSEVYGDWRGVMKETVLDEHPIKQLNDYAISKRVNELQVFNSAEQFGTESVCVRLFNTYGPGETYTPYRSAICRFIYHALHDMPYTVYSSHHRTSTYVTDTVRTLANIAEKFRAGETYNIGGTEYHDMKSVSDSILKYLGKSDRLVTYVESEPFTTVDKKVDLSKALAELDHKVAVPLSEGLPKTIDWMRAVYQSGDMQPRAVRLEDYL